MFGANFADANMSGFFISQLVKVSIKQHQHVVATLVVIEQVGAEPGVRLLYRYNNLGLLPFPLFRDSV